jgi:uncharacterized protein (TIGR00255 family)
MRSMTGFGRGRAPLGAGHIFAELRTVNHRFLDLKIRLPGELASQEERVDRRLRQAFTRGRVEAVLRLERPGESTLRFNEPLARQLVSSLESVRNTLGLDEPISINALAALPQLFQQEPFQVDDDAAKAIAAALDQAIATADAMRKREAEKLAQDLLARMDQVGQFVARLKQRADQAGTLLLERLKERLALLLQDEELQLDEARLAQEVALLADRADVTEELIRLESHVAQFRKICCDDGPLGQRLDFLLQEMSREANTMGAKAPDADFQHIVVDLRGTLARLRQQVQNIE